MTDTFPNFTLAQVRDLFDAGAFSDGLSYCQTGKLAHPSRCQNRLYAEVQGSGATPYRVSLSFEGQILARCTCPAARRNPLCKHAAAVMAAWAKAPEGFVASDNPPELDQARSKKARVKTGETDDAELIARGLEAVETMAAELGLSGLASVGAGRVEQLRELAANLRSYKLRRLSSLLTQLAELLHWLLHDQERFSLVAYGELLTDLVITAKGVRALQQGKLQDPKYLEELVGKTWTEKELTRRAGLELVELRYETSETADGFRVFTSHFVELGSGDLLTEKLIAPTHLKKGSNTGKRSYAGLRLTVSEAHQYPGYAPWRIKLKPGQTQETPMVPADLERVTAWANANFAREIEKFQAFRKDLFAPPDYYALLRPEGFYASAAGLAAFDAHGCALPLRLSKQAALGLEVLLEREPIGAMFGKLHAAGGVLEFEPISLAMAGKDAVVRELSP
jgi:hypothetical protein